MQARSKERSNADTLLLAMRNIWPLDLIGLLKRPVLTGTPGDHARHRPWRTSSMATSPSRERPAIQRCCGNVNPAIAAQSRAVRAFSASAKALASSFGLTTERRKASGFVLRCPEWRPAAAV
jgi:hypothetical protein